MNGPATPLARFRERRAVRTDGSTVRHVPDECRYHQGCRVSDNGWAEGSPGGSRSWVDFTGVIRITGGGGGTGRSISDEWRNAHSTSRRGRIRRAVHRLRDKWRDACSSKRYHRRNRESDLDTIRRYWTGGRLGDDSRTRQGHVEHTDSGRR